MGLAWPEVGPSGNQLTLTLLDMEKLIAASHKSYPYIPAATKPGQANPVYSVSTVQQ